MTSNTSTEELSKFNQLSNHWWDTNGEFKTLHEINPIRLQYILEKAGDIKNSNIADIGCGGGILAESLALAGATVTAIDLAEEAINAAKLHAAHSKVSIEYKITSVESLAESHANTFDIVTCLEMLEHVPNPSSVIAACAKLLKPGGHIFLSTLNRNPKAFLLAVVGAEYILNLLPKGMHEYRQFIKPSELAESCRKAKLEVQDISGLRYNPFTQYHSLTTDVSVNYLMHCQNT